MAAAGRSVTFGRIAERYEEARGGVRRGRELADAITPWLSPHSRVLDVGAGTGVVSAALAAAGHSVTPVELAPEMARKAERRFPAACVLADATRLPMARASVDAVTFVWVLHHVDDPVAALREAGRVVRPGGSVIHVSGLAAERSDDPIDIVHGRLNDVLRPGLVAASTDVAALGERAGLEVVGRSTATVTVESSPADAAKRLEDRMYAHLWDLDDATWTAVVQPAIDELRSLPDPQLVRRRTARQPVIVMRAIPVS
ncbi:MAG TPA: methyltransferase domain-containing protein [Ilumatobacteraceae bacterium]